MYLIICKYKVFVGITRVLSSAWSKF